SGRDPTGESWLAPHGQATGRDVDTRPIPIAVPRSESKRGQSGPRHPASRLFDGWLVLILLLAIPVVLYSAKETRRRVLKNQSLVRSDGIYYFVYLPSLVFDGDLDFENDYRAFGLDVNRAWQLARSLGTGLPANHWPVGTAMLWAPMYLLAHGLALCLNQAG